MSGNEALSPDTLLALLQHQAGRYGDKVAFRFSRNGDDEDAAQLTYAQLDFCARGIAARLQRLGAAGQRVLVLCQPGLDPVAGFFGCVYAGAIAVPVHQRLAPRLSSVVPDSQADFIIGPAETSTKFKTALNGLVKRRRLRWCFTDATSEDAEAWVPPSVGPDSVAMLQYTSGSIKAPKGVMLTHRNLLHNVAALGDTFGGDENDVLASWLPQHHDMGLIGTTLHPLYLGATTVQMGPGAFIKRPMRWLETISRHRATMTFAPNFAYQKCAETSGADERAALDLSSLSVAVNGAEPVLFETLRRFANAFASAGFRPEAFRPAYGLAESALLVTGGSASAPPKIEHLDRAELGRDHVVDAAPETPTTAAVVGCGRVQGGQRLIIVDPETRQTCQPDGVGEIWIAGPSVGQGYWNNPDETAETFAGYLADSGEGPFLRTGDMGFVRGGEVFITGRYKDLVAIDGRNHYPNDIEATVQMSHPALSSGRGAVFAVPPKSGTVNDRSGVGNRLVVVQEIDGERLEATEFDEIVAAIRTAVTKHHQVQAHTVALVAPMAIPMTSSGKVQRSRTRQQFLDGELQPVAKRRAPASAAGRRVADMTASELVTSVAHANGPEAAAKVAALLNSAGNQEPRQPGQTH